MWDERHNKKNSRVILIFASRRLPMPRTKFKIQTVKAFGNNPNYCWPAMWGENADLGLARVTDNCGQRCRTIGIYMFCRTGPLVDGSRSSFGSSFRFDAVLISSSAIPNCRAACTQCPTTSVVANIKFCLVKSN